MPGSLREKTVEKGLTLIRFSAQDAFTMTPEENTMKIAHAIEGAKQEPEFLFPEYVSIFHSAFSKEPESAMEIGCVLEGIRSGRWMDQIAALRNLLGKDRKAYDNRKRSLPAFTMSAYMLTRDQTIPVEKRVTQHTGILQGDFDAVQDVEGAKRMLAGDEHVAFAFTSPSGLGLKIGIRIDPAHHRESFFAAERYFQNKYGLEMDRSCKDPTRLCFVSYDPAPILNPAARAIRFDKPIDKPIDKPESGVSAGDDTDTTAADVEEMLSYIPPRPDYEDWLRISSAVFSVLPFGEAVACLQKWSPEEKEGEYFEKFRNRLAEITVATLVYYAGKHGFDARAASYRKRWAKRIRFAEPTTVANREDFSADPNDVGLPGPRQTTDELALQCFGRQQRGDAELFAALTNGATLYDHYACAWRIYRKGAWDRDDLRKTPLEIGEEVAKRYERLAHMVREDMQDNPYEPETEGKGRPPKDPRLKEIDDITKRVSKLRTAAYLHGTEEIARSLLGTKATLFDRSPHLLVTENGTVDFSEGVFREHRPADLLSKRVATSYDPEAECPRWMSFLRYFMNGDDDLISYLARAVGYSLTGYVDKDVLFFCYGKGANGKSTFTSTLKMLSGEYMTTIPIEALLTRQSDANFDYKKAEMEGRRIVVTDEIPESKTLNEAAVKALVGGDEVSARRPYEKPYNFRPTHKLWLVGNHKPDIRGTDHGIWRRIHLLPWLVTMPPEERRPRHEILAEFREELPGILNWAIRGYIDMVDNGGLQPPEAVRGATEEYQQESDQIGQFLAERAEIGCGEPSKLNRILKAYQAWCEDASERPKYQSAKKLGVYFREAGYTLSRASDNTTVVENLKITGAE